MQGFFSEIVTMLQILLGTFVVLTLGYNFNQRWPRFRWDLSVDRFGFHIYIPIITSLVISVLLTMFLRVLGTGLFAKPF